MALESRDLAVRMMKNKEIPSRNTRILFAQEFGEEFMAYFISTQPWRSWILLLLIKTHLFIRPFLLTWTPTGFLALFISFFLWRETLIFFFSIYLAGLKLESKPDYYEQILLLCPSAGWVPLWWHSQRYTGWDSGSNIGTAEKRVFFGFFGFFNAFQSNA